MSVNLVISDALHRRLPRFSPERHAAFQLAAVDVAKGRARGEHVHTSVLNKRRFYVLRRGPFALYYSVDPTLPPQLQIQSLVFEEFITEEEGDLIMDIFAGWPDAPDGQN